MWRIPAALLISLVSLSPAQATAQLVTGTVVDALGAPVPAAIVTADGASPEAVVLTNADGVFVVRLSEDFQLQSLTVERIGYEGRTFDAASLGSLQDVVLRVDNAPIELGGIVVEAESQCRLGVGAGTAVGTIWDEAKKSLQVTALTEANRIVRFETETFRRDLRPSDYSVLRGASTQRSVSARTPYRAISIEEMTNRGWFQGSLNAGWEFFAPDATILLTEEFASQHCFSAEVTPDSVLLHFTPNEVREAFPELEGTLVLDPETSELTVFRFEYVGVSDVRRGDHAGGEIRFFAAPNGLRVVREWAIRAPVFEVSQQGFGSLAVNNLRVASVQETGGRVLSLRVGDVAMDLPSEPLDLGPRDEVGAPGDAGERSASTRDLGGNRGAELVLRNDEPTPFRVTGVQLRDCNNTDPRCGDHEVDVLVPAGESRVLLVVRKERILDAFRFNWNYVGEDVVTDTAPPGRD